MSRFAWSKRKSGIWNVPAAYEYRKAGVVYAVVQETAGGWISYGINVPQSWNTSSSPIDKITAMKDAETRVRKALEGRE